MEISNLLARSDHVVMTPDYDGTATDAIYSIEVAQGRSNFAALKICDVADVDLAARVSHVNLLVIKGGQ